MKDKEPPHDIITNVFALNNYRYLFENSQDPAEKAVAQAEIDRLSTHIQEQIIRWGGVDAITADILTHEPKQVDKAELLRPFEKSDQQ